MYACCLGRMRSRENHVIPYEKTYLAGESYAGTTIPYLARAIRTSSTFPAPLKGLIIGNGWFSPKAQYPAYVTYGRERGLLEKSSRQTAHLDRVWKQCNSTLQTPQGDHVLVGVCEGLIDAVMQAGRETCVLLFSDIDRAYLLKLMTTASSL